MGWKYLLMLNADPYTATFSYKFNPHVKITMELAIMDMLRMELESYQDINIRLYIS
jgi:hypothetical protein